MKKTLSWALLVGGLALLTPIIMGAYGTSDISKPNGMVVVKVTGTTNLAGAAIDTVLIDASEFMVFPDVTDDELEFKIKVQPQLTSGDSCSVVYDVSADGTNWGVALSSQVYTGTTPDDEELSTWGRYIRMRITNNDTTTDSLITPAFVIVSARNR